MTPNATFVKLLSELEKLQEENERRRLAEDERLTELRRELEFALVGEQQAELELFSERH